MPEPDIEVLTPRGLRMNIPNVDGIELVSFHISVNKDISELYDGDYSKDVVNPKRDKWVYENKQLKLKFGDRLSYWIYVQYKNLGYRSGVTNYMVRGNSFK